jgi:outer membrane protein assembly factor BamB
MSFRVWSWIAALVSVAAVSGSVPAGAARPAEAPGVKPAADPGPEAARRLRPGWVGEASAGAIVSSPVYADGSVYYVRDAYPRGDRRSGLRIGRRAAPTGKVLGFAAAPVDALFLGRPVASGGLLHTVSAYEGGEARAHLWAYAMGGEVVWKREVAGEKFVAEPVLAGSMVIAVSESGCYEAEAIACKRTTLRAFRARDGALTWERTVTGGNPGVSASAGRVVVHRVPGAGRRDDGLITAFAAGDGRELWSRAGIPVGGRTIIDHDRVYVASGRLWALGAGTGATAWVTGDRGFHDVESSPEGIFAVSGADRVVGLDAGGGQRWAAPGSPAGPLTVSNGVLYFQNYVIATRGPAQLVALRATSGELLRRLTITGDYSRGAVTTGGGRVFTDRYLTAIVAFAP